MKKLMFITMVGLGSMLAGCDDHFEDASDKYKAWTIHGNDISTKVVEIEGHKYIILNGYCAGDIIHAESCSCKNKLKE